MRLLLAAVVALALFAGITTSSSAKFNMKRPGPIVRGLLCIHQYEGAWDDPASPYWGGLQMDLSFQRTHGWIRVSKHTPRVHKVYFLDKWGTADNWPVWAQLVAGIHGYFSRGWAPWPNTARSCGLR